MTDLVTVFRTRSDVEASVVRGLLEAHGVPSATASDVPHSLFPLTVSALGEVRISVNAGDADAARRIIESHRTVLPERQLVRLRDEFHDLQQAIGYRFRDVGLLEHAMTHTSRAEEDVSGGVVDNESLEFLGDAVLGFVIADHLYREFPAFDEGQKSKTKAVLVSASALARQAEQLSLGDHLLLGRGEEKTGGRRKRALLADGYEALIAAIYLDGGIEPVRAFILREFTPLIDDIRRHGLSDRDPKSSLQEYVHRATSRCPIPGSRAGRSIIASVSRGRGGQRRADRVGGGASRRSRAGAARLALEELKRRERRDAKRHQRKTKARVEIKNSLRAPRALR